MSTQHNLKTVLALTHFKHLLMARGLFIMAINITSVTVAWKLYELTKDPFALGASGLAEALGYIGAATVSGAFVDRRRSINILIATYAGKFILLAILVYLMFLSPNKNLMVNLIYLLMMLMGLVRAFYVPSGFTLFRQIVPHHFAMRASSVNSTIWQMAAITGPAVAGFCYSMFGASNTLLLALAFIGIGILALIPILKSDKYPAPEKRTEGFREKFLAGIHFVAKSPILFPAMLLDMFAVLFGGAVALLPIYANEILLVGPTGLGFLRAAPSVGALMTAVTMANRNPMIHIGRNLFVAVFGYGICMICFALSRNFYLSLALLALSGALDNISVIVRSAIMQIYTPDHMRGRVASVGSIFISSSNEIGAFESGLTAKYMGAVMSVVFGGSMTLVTVILMAIKSPTLRKLEHTPHNH